MKPAFLATPVNKDSLRKDQKTNQGQDIKSMDLYSQNGLIVSNMHHNAAKQQGRADPPAASAEGMAANNSLLMTRLIAKMEALEAKVDTQENCIEKLETSVGVIRLDNNDKEERIEFLEGTVKGLKAQINYLREEQVKSLKTKEGEWEKDQERLGKIIEETHDMHFGERGICKGRLCASSIEETRKVYFGYSSPSALARRYPMENLPINYQESFMARGKKPLLVRRMSN